MNFRLLLTAVLLSLAARSKSEAADPIASCLKDPASLRGVIAVAAETSPEALATLAKTAPAVVIAGGRVFVTTEDGSITAFGAP